MVNITCVIGLFWMYVYNYMYIVDAALDERSKDSLRGKCTQYLARAEQLKKYVQKKNKRVHGGTPAEFTSTSTGGNPLSPHSSSSLTVSEVTSAYSVRALVVVV